MTSRSRTNRLRDERGANLIEFGLVFPLLLMITLGIMQVGIVYNNWVMLTDGVRAGARVLSISRAPRHRRVRAWRGGAEEVDADPDTGQSERHDDGGGQLHQPD